MSNALNTPDQTWKSGTSLMEERGWKILSPGKQPFQGSEHPKKKKKAPKKANNRLRSIYSF